MVTTTLTANPPVTLTDGVYTDTVTLRLVGSDGLKRESTMNLQVTKAADTIQLYTNFALGAAPTAQKSISNSGQINVVIVSDSTPGGASSSGGWVWSSIGGGVVGTQPQATTVQPPSFPQYIPPPVQNYDHQQVRLEIDQRLMLEGEGFRAHLAVNNTSASALQTMSVNIQLTDLNNVDQSAKFDLIPQVPTSLGDVNVGGATSGDWLILPSRLNVASLAGQSTKSKRRSPTTGTARRIPSRPRRKQLRFILRRI